MVDYIESVIKINHMLKDLQNALLAKDAITAKEICQHMIVETRLLHQQIRIQFENR